ncbi:MAG TPA: hypothetical protein VHQ41_02040 [Patescibacteria group bacterium]|jgi:hypothetical protein|nr:hypothetical protein [Patescibacteria group bacterium]
MKKVSVTWLVLVQFSLALEWLHATTSKWLEPDFIVGINKTLETFAAKTPYHFYSSFLNSVAVPHAQLFGNLIRIGELGVGLTLLAGGIFLLSKKELPAAAQWLVIIACFGAALMNLNFFLASGWTSPAAWGLNILMATIEIILGVFYIQALQHQNDIL